MLASRTSSMKFDPSSMGGNRRACGVTTTAPRAFLFNMTGAEALVAGIQTKDYVDLDCVVITFYHHDHNLIVILRDVDDLQVLLLVARHHQGATQAAAMLIGIPGSLKS